MENRSGPSLSTCDSLKGRSSKEAESNADPAVALSSAAKEHCEDDTSSPDIIDARSIC